jgi:hypothetical protein
MAAQQMEAWKNLVVALIPAAVLLAVSIIVIKKHRGWYSTLLVVAAVLNLLIPIAMQLTQDSLNQRGRDILAKNPGIKTAQEAQQILASDATIQSYSTFKNWFGQGFYITTLAFAFALFITIGALLPKSGNKLAQQPADAESKTPDVS